MPEQQSCGTCEYFEQEPVKPYGWCDWSMKNLIPDCHEKNVVLTGLDHGAACPCWRVKGYIETYLAGLCEKEEQ